MQTERSTDNRGEHYTAESLEDIAVHFDEYAQAEQKEVRRLLGLPSDETNRARVKTGEGAAFAYAECARILRSTKLKGL